jgi:hypothetical protein
VAARVRIPLGVQSDQVVSTRSRGEVGVHAGLSSRRSRVRVPSGPPSMADRHCLVDQPEQSGDLHGRVAQLAEHTPEKRGVTGSTPVSTTNTTTFGSSFLFSRLVFPADLFRFAQSNESFLGHCRNMCAVFSKDISKSQAAAVAIRMAIHLVEMPLTGIKITMKPDRVIKAC